MRNTARNSPQLSIKKEKIACDLLEKVVDMYGRNVTGDCL
ncbi:MAG: hypothetical protein ACJAVI_006106 [Candidatus Azotimanducaceae bacterium]|jgi:hypothetical protein